MDTTAAPSLISPRLKTLQGTALDDYVLKVFGNDRKAHALAVQQVDSFKQPLARTKLVVQIVSGSNLYPKDITGASDPFVVLELRDRRRLRYHRPRVQKRALPEHHFESSVKEQTLNPSWNEGNRSGIWRESCSDDCALQFSSTDSVVFRHRMCF
eukprot:m.331727 g.331727  ORF g.331727 m.331727 type:complete len:155 (-) comp19773_c0_seq4:8226-8690(-)